MEFDSALVVEKLIGLYFEHIAGEFHFEEVPDKRDETTRKKVWDRDAEPPTFTGLALYLGFDSRDAFTEYEHKGEFASTIKRGRLRIEVEYEKRLHQQSPSGAIFALKNMGWNERENSPLNNEPSEPLQVNIIEVGLNTASSETDVAIS